MPDPRPHSLRAAVGQAGTPEQLARCLQEERERLREENARQPHGIRTCRALSDAADVVIQRLLVLALPEDPALRESTRSRIAIIANGGYGRRALCPFSDIDVTFLVAEVEDPALDATVRRLFMGLMETFSQRLGIKVGYGYRTLADAAHLEHQTQTALLDLRVVTGSHELTERFLREVFRHIWPGAFIRQKVAERRAMLEKHGGTLYRIEPEIREGLGGLRDLHLAEWLAAVSFPSVRGDVWRQLQRLGAVTRRDGQEIQAAREFLLTLRCWIHWEAGRGTDLLTRERQEGLAAVLGFEDDERASRVEHFMEAYYRHAETIRRISGFVVERCLAERLGVSDELVCSGGELLLAYPWVRVATPGFLVQICQLYQEHGVVPSHELRRMLAQHVDACPELGTDREAADDFLGLLRVPAPVAGGPQDGVRPGVHQTLSMMAELGILQRFLPEFGEAYRRVPFDQIHRHTVGFHSLEVVGALERLRVTQEERLMAFRRAWAEVQAPELLYLAGLLHDVGKLAPVGGHAEAGAEMARALCERLGLDAHAAARAEMLVRHHLLMSETAQLRDLTLEKTIRDFTQVIDTVDLLNMLFLLTCADMEATGVLSPMKIRFLEDLYYRAEAALAAAAAPGATAERDRRFRSRISRQLSATNLTPDQIRAHTEGMPVSYLLNTRPEQIALHIRMVEALQSTGPVVEFDHDPGGELTTIHICTLEQPQPGLLSQIAGVLYAHEISVHGAQVFTRHSDPPIALDTLWADYHGRAIPPFKRLELEQDLLSVLRDGDIAPVIARYKKQLPPPGPLGHVRVDNELAEGHSVLEVQAEDQPALLYRLTRAAAALGWDIHSARISTLGDRARDAFYVTGPDGGKLEEPEGRLVDAFLQEFAS